MRRAAFVVLVFGLAASLVAVGSSAGAGHKPNHRPTTTTTTTTVPPDPAPAPINGQGYELSFDDLSHRGYSAPSDVGTGKPLP